MLVAALTLNAVLQRNRVKINKCVFIPNGIIYIVLFIFQSLEQSRSNEISNLKITLTMKDEY